MRMKERRKEKGRVNLFKVYGNFGIKMCLRNLLLYIMIIN